MNIFYANYLSWLRRSGLLFVFVLLVIKTNAQTFNYTKSTLNVDVIVSNACDGSTSNGTLTFKVNAAAGGSATLVLVDGPVTTDFPGQAIATGTSFVYTPPSDQAGDYNFVIHDASNTINTFTPPFGPVLITDLSVITLTSDPGNNLSNSSCTTPNGKVGFSLTGGSRVLAGGGSFKYTITRIPTVSGYPLTGTYDGSTTLDIKTLYNIANPGSPITGLSGAVYTVVIADNYSSCGATTQWTVTDPSPIVYNVATTTPSVCIGSGGTVTLSNSEASNVTYQVFKGGVSDPSVPSQTGTNGLLTFTILASDLTPTATYNFTIQAVNGSCTPAFMNGTASIIVSPTNTVSAASSTPTLCINTALTPITFTTTGATGIGAPTGLPAGVTAAWAANTITVSGTPTVAGLFSYSIPLTGGCGSVNATGTITLTPGNTVSAASSTPTLCINTALTPITFTTTGATGIGAPTGLPAGVTCAWADYTITVSGTPTVAGLFSYSIPLTGGCGLVNATGTITVTAANTVSAASSTPTLCINTALTPITFTTTGATGIGAPTGLPAGVTAAWAANTITVSGTPTVAGLSTYSIPLTGGCGSVNATGTITVTPGNTVSAASSTPTLCINTALTPITFTTTGATGIGAPTGLPAGVTAAWAANKITVSGTPTVSGLFSYSIPLTGGCGNVNATGTITVDINTITLSSAAGTNSQTPCINTAITNITYATTGATGATFSGLPAGVTGSWSSNVATISGTPTVTGPFSYTVTLTGGCGSVNATGTITVSPNNTVGAASSTPTLCINTALTPITFTTTGATGIGAPTGLPAGVTAAWAANTITVSGTPTVAGLFSYSIPLTGGCGSVNATGTITVTAGNTVSAASSTPTLCINTALIPITFTTTGATGIGAPTGLPAGVTAAWAANKITVSGTPTAAGVFSYSIPLTGGCGSVNATGTITVTAGNTVSAASSTPTLCINTALTPITFTTTGATGIGAPTGLPAGVTAAWAANTITVSGTPTVAGLFSYSIPLTGGCGSVNATGTITVTPGNTVSAASSTPTLCINTALTPITFTTTGATGIGAPTGLPAGVTAAWAANTITVSGTPTVAGLFSYSIPLTGGCGVVNATGTITVTAANTVSAASSTPTLCINTALTPITFTTTGATGIGAPTGLPAGVTAAWAANTITVSGTPTVAGLFSYSIPLTGGCGVINATGTITVTPGNTVSAASSSPSLCINTALTPITFTTTGATGIGAPTGLPAGVTAAWAANTITVSGTPTVSGLFSYSIPLTGGCGNVNATGTITVDINTITLSSAAGTNSQTPCINTAITNITYATTGATGATFSGLPAGVTGSWSSNVATISGTPTVTGPFSYTVTLTGGCGSVNATGTITVAAANTITLSSPAGTDTQTPCVNTAITNITYATTGATGATFSGLPAGVTGSWSSNVATISGTPTVTGPFGYTVTLTGGCGSMNATGTITVNVNTITLSSVAGTNSQAPCINTAITNITYATTGATGATFSGLPAGVTGSWSSNVATISGTPTVTGPFSYTVTLTGGCGSVNATGTITVTAANTIALSSPVGTDTQSPCINTAITNITYATTGATGATFSGLPAGVTGSWSSNVATISGTPTATGPFSYTVTLTGGCSSVNTTGTITVTAANTVTLSSPAGTDTQTPCINTAITNITYATTGATGATFTGLPAGVTGSWASNVATISGTPTVTGPFSYTVTLTGGCCTVTATGTITVTAANTITLSSPVGTDAQTPCINTAITNITYATTGATGATFSGLPTGVTGIWSSNVATISGTPTATGPFSYTVTLTGGCGSVTGTGTITVNVNTITLSSPVGTDIQTPCINTAITNITYTTTGATGATFSGLPTGVTGSWSSNIATISGTPTVTGPFSYTVTLTGGCGTVTATGTITVNTPPSTSAITGTTPVCASTTGVSYSVTNTAGSTYTWTITGGTQSGGGTTNSITVDWGATTGSGNVSVTEMSAAGCVGTPVNFAVVINGATTSAITGMNSVCENTTGVSYDVTNTVGSAYAWTITGGTQSGGTNTNSITVDWGSAGAGSVSVTETTLAGGRVGAPVNLTVTINVVPSITSVSLQRMQPVWV